MKTLIRVTAQYYENYAANNTDWDGKEEAWKPKGSQEFEFFADSDHFLYNADDCVKAIQSLLEDESGSFVRYEYIQHDIIFSEIFPLEGFDEKLQKIIESKKVKV